MFYHVLVTLTDDSHSIDASSCPVYQGRSDDAIISVLIVL